MMGVRGVTDISGAVWVDCVDRIDEPRSEFGDLDVDAAEFPVDEGVLVYHDFGGLELEDHEGGDCVHLEGAVGPSHRPRVQEVVSVVLRRLQLVRVPSYQHLHPQLLRLVLQRLLVSPGDDLMAVQHSDLDPAELEDLGRREGTFSSANSPTASSS